MHTAADYLHMLPGMLITGIGVGLTLPTLISTAVSALPPPSFATGSAVVTMARQLGSVFGVAILVAILDTGTRAAHTVTAFDHGWWFTAIFAALTGLACLSIGRARKERPATTSHSAQARVAEPRTPRPSSAGH